MAGVSRYHPFLVLLHWLLAALILGALALGCLVLEPMANSAPEKIGVLRLHMAGGMLILTLMIVRFVVRVLTVHPAPAATPYPALDRLARLAHVGFYVLIVLMLATGYATGLIAGLPAIVFGRSGAPLPTTFEQFPTFIAHSVLAGLLATLVAVHVLAALYHQFRRHDGALRRMGFGRRTPPPAST